MLPFEICDNQSVIASTMNAKCTLRKKNLSIAYHKPREVVTADVIFIFYEHSGSILAGLLMKNLFDPDRQRIISYTCGKIPPIWFTFTIPMVNGERKVL